ncbi:MAG: hypothetical protein HYS05_12035 [Acidobacteria bacterium]|nr:hypothetical protein [Acidobacteriota bacterium]
MKCNAVELSEDDDGIVVMRMSTPRWRAWLGGRANLGRAISPADDLCLEVKGVGRIGWPITSATARRLCAIARPARYGLKDQTRLDPRVRDTWEIPKSRVRIDERRWATRFRPLLDRIRCDLGLADGSHLKAELHNMLVYGPIQFFATHRDSEKSDDMIGTLVVILPSDFTGGAIEIEHHDERVAFRGSGRTLTFIAFYALTYNLMLDGDVSTAAPPVPAPQIAALARSLQDYFDTPRPPRWSGDSRREVPESNLRDGSSSASGRPSSSDG